MTKKELEARNEVKWEMYTKKIQIEARVLGDLAMNHIIPVATQYQSAISSMSSRFLADSFAAFSAGNRSFTLIAVEYAPDGSTEVRYVPDAVTLRW